MLRFIKKVIAFFKSKIDEHFKALDKFYEDCDKDLLEIERKNNEKY